MSPLPQAKKLIKVKLEKDYGWKELMRKLKRSNLVSAVKICYVTFISFFKHNLENPRFNEINTKSVCQKCTFHIPMTKDHIHSPL